LTAQDIEIAVALHFGYRANVIVPNVSWGLRLTYEADLVVLRPSGWAEEIEIKTTASDIKADLKKRQQHNSLWFRKLWFAVPDKLAAHPDIPGRAGILSVTAPNDVSTVRGPKVNRNAKPMPDDVIAKLLKLGCMRIWTLKSALARRRAE